VGVVVRLVVQLLQKKKKITNKKVGYVQEFVDVLFVDMQTLGLSGVLVKEEMHKETERAVLECRDQTLQVYQGLQKKKQ
jgi:hypothetical protein